MQARCHKRATPRKEKKEERESEKRKKEKKEKGKIKGEEKKGEIVLHVTIRFERIFIHCQP